MSPSAPHLKLIPSRPRMSSCRGHSGARGPHQLWRERPGASPSAPAESPRPGCRRRCLRASTAGGRPGVLSCPVCCALTRDPQGTSDGGWLPTEQLRGTIRPSDSVTCLCPPPRDSVTSHRPRARSPQTVPASHAVTTPGCPGCSDPARDWRLPRPPSPVPLVHWSGSWSSGSSSAPDAGLAQKERMTGQVSSPMGEAWGEAWEGCRAPGPSPEAPPPHNPACSPAQNPRDPCAVGMVTEAPPRRPGRPRSDPLPASPHPRSFPL